MHEHYYALGAVAALGLAVFMLVFGMLFGVPVTAPRELGEGLAAARREEALEASPLLRLTMPATTLLAGLNRRLEIPTYWAWLTPTLRNAGSPASLSPPEFLAIAELSSVAGLAVAAYGSVMGAGRPVPLLLAMGALAGLVVPHLLLRNRASERLRDADNGLPYAISLIVMAMDVGLSFREAIAHFVERGRGRPDVLRSELAIVLGQLGLGKTLRPALLELVDRLPSESVRALVVAVVQSEERGYPIAKTLREQMQVILSRRTQRAEKQAAESSVKVLAPMMLIFLAVFLTIFSSIILRGCSGQGLL